MARRYFPRPDLPPTVRPATDLALASPSVDEHATRVTTYLRVPHGFAAMPGAAPALVRQQRWELVTELSAALGAP